MKQRPLPFRLTASLSDIMELQLETGLPVYVEKNARVFGVIEAADIHRALIKRNTAQSDA